LQIVSPLTPSVKHRDSQNWKQKSHFNSYHFAVLTPCLFIAFFNSCLQLSVYTANLDKRAIRFYFQNLPCIVLYGSMFQLRKFLYILFSFK